MDKPDEAQGNTQWLRGRVAGVLLFALGGVTGAGAFAAWAPTERASVTAAASASGNVTNQAERGVEPSAPPARARVLGSGVALRWLGVGGGADPSSTQVQLEQDLALFTELAGAGGSLGAILFAGGPGVRAVQVLDSTAPLGGDAHQRLRVELGMLLDPRPERDARFRLPSLKVDAPGDAGSVLALLREQLALPGERLEVFVAAHGDVGETPAQNYVSLWGDTSFDARELATALMALPARRPARFVITSCFGGGFAELAFASADSGAGPATHGACGLFATSAEHESNGCDANPNRQAQEGYALHLLNALRGHGRDGQPVTGLDLDGDGQIGLLEGHTRARIASNSIDLPSTTSERFLRSLGLEHGDASHAPEPPSATPEEDAVIAALGERLAVHDEASVTAALADVEADLEALAQRTDTVVATEEEARHPLGLAIAARWPELLDPFRADFDATLQAHADEVAAVLHSEDAHELRRLQQQTDTALMAEDQLRLRWVLLTRLSRALETRRLVGALRARPASDPARVHYEALLACERAPLGR